jgi:hypothetical protein
MTRQVILRAVVFVVLASLSLYANAQGMPAHVHESLGRLVGEWNVITVVGEEKFTSVAVIKWSDDQKCIIISAKGKSFVTGQDASTTDLLGWDEAKKLIVEYAINGDGSGATGTYQIREDGTWAGPMQGCSIVDGAPVHFQACRELNWKSDNEMEAKFTHTVGGGQRAPDMIQTYKRK